ncbi:hypothetical protein [Actinacidiphila sp. bgisy144]|uniref:hypothetical protein n=1 Tax=Actinacidiphila sp. bgisy144 TaxID=3413791 RepID=UPI003EBB6846
MTVFAFDSRYVTQIELARAYKALGHIPAVSTRDSWSAILLVHDSLSMSWACRVLEPPEFREERPAAYAWHIIAQAGELGWPPLRPEAEIWPALLAKEPVPTGEKAEREARMWGQSIEELHRTRLRRHYLGDAYIGNMKRNQGDINFDPLVRDWDATAREFADFLDTHRPPNLTPDQRVMEQGVRLVELETEAVNARASLASLMRNAERESRRTHGTVRRGFKTDLSRWGGVSRPTVDAWLYDSMGVETDDAPGES